MNPTSRLIGAFCSLVLAASASASASVLTLQPEHITPPASDRVFPVGPGSAAANAYCLACHSVGMVMTQPDLTQRGWQDEVIKMRDAFKAPIPDDEIATLADYFYSIKGSTHGAVAGDAS